MQLREKLAYALSSLLLLFPLLYSIDWYLRDWRISRYHITLGASEGFLFLAFVPGVLAVVYHLVTVRERRDQNIKDVDQYFIWLAGHKPKREQQVVADRVKSTTKGPVSAKAATLLLTAVVLFVAIIAAHKPKREQQVVADRVKSTTKGPVSANAATLLLTAVFLFVAIIAGYTPGWKETTSAGIVYAGLGAYSSVLYYMVARLYASALSSRFLMSSAIGSASAVVMGWVFASIGLSVLGVDPKSFNLASVLFLTGLFHKWAFDALRRRARKLFGQPDPETIELPLDIIEGIDDVHADLLSEYGVSTVQHLATAEPGELCERTLLPLDRITDWIDQATLVCYLRKNILQARTLGIRGALDLVMTYDLALLEPAGAMSKLLDALAEKASTPRAALDSIAIRLRGDYSVALLYALQEGKEYAPAATTDAVMPNLVRELSTNYDFVNGQATTQFEI